MDPSLPVAGIRAIEPRGLAAGPFRGRPPADALRSRPLIGDGGRKTSAAPHRGRRPVMPDLPNGACMRILASPMRFSGEGPPIRQRPPALGRHNEEAAAEATP